VDLLLVKAKTIEEIYLRSVLFLCLITTAVSAFAAKDQIIYFSKTDCDLIYDGSAEELQFVPRNGETTLIARGKIKFLSSHTVAPSASIRSVLVGVGNRVLWINENGRVTPFSVAPSSVRKAELNVINLGLEGRAKPKDPMIVKAYSAGLLYKVSFVLSDGYTVRNFILRSKDGTIIETKKTTVPQNYTVDDIIFASPSPLMYSTVGDFIIDIIEFRHPTDLYRRITPPGQLVTKDNQRIFSALQPGYIPLPESDKAKKSSGKWQTRAQEYAEKNNLVYVPLSAENFTSEGNSLDVVNLELTLYPNRVVEIIYNSNTLKGNALYYFNLVQKFAPLSLKSNESDRLFATDYSGKSISLSNPCILPLSELTHSEGYR
jgi:hypothetical protein